MKHITLFFIAIALFFTNIHSAYSSLATSNFEETKEDIEIIDTDTIYAGQKLRGILDYGTVASLICFNFLLVLRRNFGYF